MKIFAVLRWLTRDTFLQARAAGVHWFMLGVSSLAILICLTARYSSSSAIPEKDVAATPQQLQLAFGLISVPGADAASQTKILQVILAGWVADAGGILLALLWTAGFMPSFLESSAVSILLAKPLPRAWLFAGKFIGVLAFVLFQALVFIGGTWLALGLRLNVWDPFYFWTIPLLLLHFSVFYCFSSMLAVATRSTAACVFGSLFVWLLCWSMNFGRQTLMALPQLEGISSALVWSTEAGYWLLPKPLDFQILLQENLQARNLFGHFFDIDRIAANGAWLPTASVVSSLIVALLVLAGSAYDLKTADY